MSWAPGTIVGVSGIDRHLIRQVGRIVEDKGATVVVVVKDGDGATVTHEVSASRIISIDKTEGAE